MEGGAEGRGDSKLLDGIAAFASSTHSDELHRAIMGKHQQQADKLEILPPR